MSMIVSSFAAAAHAVRDTVARIPYDAWEGPGLGEWTVRDLVGHTSRSLITVIDYFARPVDEEVVPSAAAYFTAISGGSFDSGAVTERGRQAGRDLGDHPPSRFHALVDQAVRVAEETDPDLVVHTLAGGMRVAAFLPTRTFELCVHGLDIAAATGVRLDLPSAPVEESAAVAALSAAQRGLGPDLLLAMTGRRSLPPGFSVV
ncbi:maleylpyruvate isomerase N-terminal domain-containing protein [Nocardioides sp. LHG3406-4]|uniref:maleylpyruvate isomerase N-terminal domain-containing protein n=1 Tax=Nocardioides sp. LHG3406-4 TaxID=2804575 RepID=UPI003CEB39FB